MPNEQPKLLPVDNAFGSTKKRTSPLLAQSSDRTEGDGVFPKPFQRLPTQVTAEVGIAFPPSGESNVGYRPEINQTKIHNQSKPMRSECVVATNHDAPKPLVDLDLPIKGTSTDYQHPSKQMTPQKP